MDQDVVYKWGMGTVVRFCCQNVLPYRYQELFFILFSFEHTLNVSAHMVVHSVINNTVESAAVNAAAPLNAVT